MRRAATCDEANYRSWVNIFYNMTETTPVETRDGKWWVKADVIVKRAAREESLIPHAPDTFQAYASLLWLFDRKAIKIVFDINHGVHAEWINLHDR